MRAAHHDLYFMRAISIASVFMLSSTRGLSQDDDCDALLDGSCIACSSGECVEIDALGRFHFFNLPAGNGYLRLDFVCLRDEEMSCYSASSYFLVPDGDEVSFPNLGVLEYFEAPLPTTTSLEMSVDDPTLTATSQDTQARVTAGLSDGTTANVTSPPEVVGTSYATSRAAVATVDETGKVVPVSNGAAFITARNGSATSVTRVTVSLGDPLTSVHGLVQRELANGSRVAVQGATASILLPGVDCDGRDCTAATGTDGRFTVDGVITALGELEGGPDSLTVTARYVDSTGNLLLGVVVGVAPSTDGSATDAGTIVLTDQACEFDSTCLVSGCQVTLGDDESARIDFTGGFVFPYFRADYDHVYINSNGNLTFAEADGETYDPEVPAGVVDGPPRISPLFVDLAPGEGGGVYYHQTADKFVVTWYQVPVYHYDDSQNTAQAILHRDGRIHFAYGDLTTDGSAVGADEELDISVGVSPGGEPSLLSKDYSLDGPFSSTGLQQAVMESFHGSASEDAAAGVDTSNLFDLEQACLLWHPNGDDGFDVYFVKVAGSGTGGGGALAAKERRKPGRPEKTPKADDE